MKTPIRMFSPILYGMLAFTPTAMGDYSWQSTSAHLCVNYWFSRPNIPNSDPIVVPNPISRAAWGWAWAFGFDSGSTFHPAVSDAILCIDASTASGSTPANLWLDFGAGGFDPGAFSAVFVNVPAVPTHSEPAEVATRGGSRSGSNTCPDSPAGNTWYVTGASASASSQGTYTTGSFGTQLNLRVTVGVDIESSSTACSQNPGSATFRDVFLSCIAGPAGCLSFIPGALSDGTSSQDSRLLGVFAAVDDQEFVGGIFANPDGTITEHPSFSVDDNGDIVFSVLLPTNEMVDVSVLVFDAVQSDLDLDGDSSVTCDDVFELARLVTQFGGTIDTLDDEDLVRRFNLDAGDGLEIVDAADVALFQRIVEAFFEDEPCLFLDVNRDGVVDPCDVAYARAQSFVSTDADVRLDQNQDGAYDQDDLDLIIAGVLAEYGYIDGDVNGDFLVDLNDYAILVNNFGMTGLPHGSGESRHLGDLNDDGNVDTDDFSILAQNFGSTGCP